MNSNEWHTYCLRPCYVGNCVKTVALITGSYHLIVGMSVLVYCVRCIRYKLCREVCGLGGKPRAIVVKEGRIEIHAEFVNA